MILMIRLLFLTPLFPILILILLYLVPTLLLCLLLHPHLLLHPIALLLQNLILLLNLMLLLRLNRSLLCLLRLHHKPTILELALMHLGVM